MIFVTVGSTRVPFDRLVRAADSLADARRVVVQRGASKVEPTHAEYLDFLSFQELTRHLSTAEIVVAHAGVGTIVAALTEGKKPIVVPRRRDHGEAVDDHQLPFARKLARAGLVSLVEEPDALLAAVLDYGAANGVQLRRDGRLADEIRTYLAAEIGLPAPVGAPADL